MTTDLTFITNEENNKLVDRFAALIKDSQYFDCLVGYFYTSGFHSLYRSLENTEKIRILIGISTNKETYDLIQESQQSVMLGKVFENLLTVTDRKSKGAFYTPREIVHYMCQQSLINYLETNTDVPLGDIETFIQHGDLAQQITSRVDVDDKYIPASIKNNRDKIDKLLKNIKIVDPAVGSGAFPMGMMNEIVKVRSILSYLSKDVKNNYNLKRETIENCLYGVDIDSSAVDITKLRFWLSLVVDETDIKKIKPLPNLDHRIMCGNSLLEEFEGVKLFDERLLEVIPETKQIDQLVYKLYDLTPKR